MSCGPGGCGTGGRWAGLGEGARGSGCTGQLRARNYNGQVLVGSFVRPCCHVVSFRQLPHSRLNQLQNTRGRAVPERCGVMSAFEELGVSPELIRACDALGWTLPTPVQAEAVPLILGGGDVMVGASSSLPRARRALQYASPSCGFYALLHGAHADAPQRRRPGAARQAPLPCLCCKSCTRPSQGRRGQAAAAPS